MWACAQVDGNDYSEGIVTSVNGVQESILVQLSCHLLLRLLSVPVLPARLAAQCLILAVQAPVNAQGMAFARTPDQVLRIATGGSPTGMGSLLPNGVSGEHNQHSLHMSQAPHVGAADAE